jgi:hypothetical protein
MANTSFGAVARPAVGVQSEQDERFQRILQRRAQRLGVSIEEAAELPSSKPFSLLAAEAAAQRRGISVSQVLDEDFRQLENSTYPTPECLTPDEVEAFVTCQAESNKEENEWVEMRKSHLAICNGCQALLAAIQPSHERREQFNRALDAELERRPAPSPQPVRTRLVATAQAAYATLTATFSKKK